MSDGSVETWEVLKRLGFEPDSEIYSDIRPGLRYDFGNLTLAASAVTNLRFAPVVMMTGVLRTPNTLAEVQFELPRELASEEQCAAWITWNLDQYSDGPFQPSHVVPWLDEGRKNQLLLPWIADQAAYEARPCCFVEKEWARSAIKALRACVEEAPDNAEVTFSFDGEVLKIQCEGERIAVAADGAPWDKVFILRAEQLQELPRRLTTPKVEFSEWKGNFHIANWRYDGVLTKPEKP